MDFEIRQDRRGPGSQVLVREREEYFRLMSQGVSSNEACRIVGIDRRTGKHWRNGYTRSDSNKWTPPVNLVLPAPEPSRHLQESERVHIADRLRENVSLRTIAALVHLPDGRQPAQVRDALIQTVSTLPAQLRRSLTWDQGTEMALHKQFSTATDMPVFFCHPGSPWQRGSNENTNGLLRQYFPKGADLARYTRNELDAVAAELNSRPRKTLGWETPAERLHRLLTA
jgi:hypothetical protein